MSADVGFVGAVRGRLRALRDPVRAPVQQAYMKSEMPYLGVAAGAMRRVTQEVIGEYPLRDSEAWRDTVLSLWRDAAYREERHAALELVQHRGYSAYRTVAEMPLFEEIIVTGAWWDYVDAIAVHTVGGLLLSEPDATAPLMRGWSVSDHLWKRRTAIICQVGLKAEADPTLLVDCIRPNLDDRDFFIRKAIGWALRAHARHAPAWVTQYVDENWDRLSGLSRREALKHIGGERPR